MRFFPLRFPLRAKNISGITGFAVGQRLIFSLWIERTVHRKLDERGLRRDGRAHRGQRYGLRLRAEFPAAPADGFLYFFFFLLQRGELLPMLVRRRLSPTV